MSLRYRISLLAALSALPAATAAAADPSLELVQTIVSKGKAGELDHLALDVKGQRLFLSNKANNTLDVLDLKTGQLVKQIVGQNAVQGVAYAPELNRVYAALGTGGLLNVFSGDGYKILKTIKFTDDADNVRDDAVRGRVYVAHAEKALAAVDAKTYGVKADIKLPADGEAFVLEAGRPAAPLHRLPRRRRSGRHRHRQERGHGTLPRENGGGVPSRRAGRVHAPSIHRLPQGADGGGNGHGDGQGTEQRDHPR